MLIITITRNLQQTKHMQRYLNPILTYMDHRACITIILYKDKWNIQMCFTTHQIKERKKASFDLNATSLIVV